MNLSNLSSPRGARSGRKRLGRGESSGRGKTAGRGNKGQKSRTGRGKIKAYFQGGQIPLIRRIPKFGFTNIFRVEPTIVNLKDLDGFDAGTVVDLASLKARGMAKGSKGLLKILGQGELKKALTVKANAFSKKALDAIQKAGGIAEVVK
ncbi:MAG: 50S ribosomal protein L15 [Pseudomonadota bacterium]